MKTMDVIYKILETLDQKLDDKSPDFSEIKHDQMGISSERWSYILEMMQDAGLIKDVNFSKGGRQRAPQTTFINNMQITFRGVHFLAENTSTAKVIKAAKLLKDTIPGL